MKEKTFTMIPQIDKLTRWHNSNITSQRTQTIAIIITCKKYDLIGIHTLGVTQSIIETIGVRHQICINEDNYWWIITNNNSGIIHQYRNNSGVTQHNSGAGSNWPSTPD